MRDVKTIIVEHDGQTADIDYNQAYKFLESNGFKIVKDFMGEFYGKKPMRHVVLAK